MATKLSKMASPELKQALVELRQWINDRQFEDNLNVEHLGERAAKMAFSMGENREIEVRSHRVKNAWTYVSTYKDAETGKKRKAVVVEVLTGTPMQSSGEIDALLAHEIAHAVAEDSERRKGYRRAGALMSSAAAVTVMAGEAYLGRLGIPGVYAHYLGSAQGMSFEVLLSGIGTYSLTRKALGVVHLANMRSEELRADEASVRKAGETDTVMMLLRMAPPDAAHGVINEILDEGRVKSEASIIARAAGYAVSLYGRAIGWLNTVNYGTHPDVRKRVKNALEYSRLDGGA
jgi:Zn-dependent protease with chaperone function